ncbi:MAG TPA: PLP-dependent transferase, partial [Lacibacter sp.]|nr:PLP-dependent transferase [Lacibacter sp.]
MKQRSFSPESLMMSYGYEPSWSEGSVKCPVFQTSTFEFTTAEQGKAYFELAYGLREPRRHEQQGMIYSRINNPNMEILEERLRLWDGAEACAAFESGMSAISTVLLEFLRPGDLLLFGTPLYGGTHHFIHHVLTKFGIHVRSFTVHDTEEQLEQILQESGLAHRLGMIYLETPANPTNDLLDIDLMARLARRHSSPDRPVYLAVDNTYMGPLWQQPLQHGADLVLYSATKYIGGHSDLIARAVLGSREIIGRVKGLRNFCGN